eukprot:m.157568 g.157568  ORF g.157568 m.157568 type:complete len:175 (-) comp14472_c0_seq1:2800-3324(-)
MQVGISRAHGHDTAVLHRGVWIAVLRRPLPSSGHMQVLMLKRNQDMATCPGAWGLVGEHSLPHEPWLATTRRALMEELGLPKSVVAAQRPLVMRGERGEASVLVRTEYTETNRRELQATALVAVVLPDDIIPLIRPDDEVAEMKWQTYGRVPNSSPSFGAGIDTDYGIHRMRRG